MKKILLIGTGGTIASEMTEEGLAPELTTEQLLHQVPGISKICDVDCRQLFTIDSTNMTPKHWVEIARVIREEYENYDGFVITHGTDTMAYTAAALSYLIQNSRKPIVLTGAQKPIGFETTDSRMNMTDAFLCAAKSMPGVQIVFNGKVIIGTRACKTHSKSFQAFSSINYPYLAVLQDGRILRYIKNEPSGPVRFFDSLNQRVGVLKLTPGMGTDVLEYLMEHHDAVIIESFGVGGLPSYDHADFYACIRRFAAMGKIVVMTTQVSNEGSDLAVYHVGHRLKSEPGVLEAYDMTTEAVVAKVMWILAQTRDFEEISRLFYTPVAYDLLYNREVIS